MKVTKEYVVFLAQKSVPPGHEIGGAFLGTAKARLGYISGIISSHLSSIHCRYLVILTDYLEYHIEYSNSKGAHLGHLLARLFLHCRTTYFQARSVRLPN